MSVTWSRRPTAGRLHAGLRRASLRVRVMAAAALLVAATCLVTGVVGATLLRGYLLGRSDAQLRGFAHVTARIAGRAHPPAPPRAQQRQALPAQFLVELVAADGRVRLLGVPVHTAVAPRLPAAQLNQVGTPFTVPAAGAGPAWRVFVQRLPGGEHEVVAYSLGDLDNTVTRLEIADTVAGAFAVVLLAAIGLPLVRASLSPLAEIEATAAAIADGDLSRRIDHPSGKTEVGRLALALDTMLATIESAYRARASGEQQAQRSEARMRQFVADASHELRTPLTSVRGLAEYGLQQGDHASPDELLRLMSMIQREASRMTRLVEELLLLARHDTGRPLDLAPIDLASIAAEATQHARAAHPGRVVTLDADEPAVVMADAERIRQVIDNLIGNAIQHTPPESPVTITVTTVPSGVQLSVADQGPGMTAEQAAHVFERFYRTDDARTRARGGTGLGLAIAASLTGAHGGQITLDTQPGHGAVFHLRLPTADSHEQQPAAGAPAS
ncbi:MAG TPA: HAMP domain-containing sensor histidine kinase [Streptosporangiaceae bacterium]